MLKKSFLQLSEATELALVIWFIVNIELLISAALT